MKTDYFPMVLDIQDNVFRPVVSISYSEDGKATECEVIHEDGTVALEVVEFEIVNR